jgi:WD40 repeat protein
LIGNWDNIVKIWDIETKKERELRGHNGVISSVNYSPD